MLANKIFDLIDTIYAIIDNNNIVRTNNIEKYKEIKNLKSENNLVHNIKNNTWYEYKTFDYKENNQNYKVEIYKDITKYKQNDINEIDFTTKLLNKQTTFKQLEEYLKSINEKPESFTLAMADIDFFKKINDTYGHLAGDEILKQISECLIKNTKGDDIVGRFGGEEFIILLKNTNLDNSKALLEKIRKDIDDLIVKYNNFIIDNLNISIGAVFNQDNNTDLNNLIEKADKALYNVKENGRNQTKFFDEI
jgi:diguanylate cyclase (GGDEF)-like protein